MATANRNGRRGTPTPPGDPLPPPRPAPAPRLATPRRYETTDDVTALTLQALDAFASGEISVADGNVVARLALATLKGVEMRLKYGPDQGRSAPLLQAP